MEDRDGEGKKVSKNCNKRNNEREYKKIGEEYAFEEREMKTQEEEARPIDRKGDRRKEKDGKTAIT